MTTRDHVTVCSIGEVINHVLLSALPFEANLAQSTLYSQYTMKILVADRISPLGVEFLQNQADFEVIEAYGSSPEKVLELSKDASAIIVRSDTKVSKEVIAGASQLKVVGRPAWGWTTLILRLPPKRA